MKDETAKYDDIKLSIAESIKPECLMLNIKEPTYVCPKCGYTGTNSITLTWYRESKDSPFVGKSEHKRYCFECYAKWMAENIPELVEVEDESRTYVKENA